MEWNIRCSNRIQSILTAARRCQLHPVPVTFLTSNIQNTISDSSTQTTTYTPPTTNTHGINFMFHIYYYLLPMTIHMRYTHIARHATKNAWMSTLLRRIHLLEKSMLVLSMLVTTHALFKFFSFFTSLGWTNLKFLIVVFIIVIVSVHTIFNN